MALLQALSIGGASWVVQEPTWPFLKGGGTATRRFHDWAGRRLRGCERDFSS